MIKDKIENISRYKINSAFEDFKKFVNSGDFDINEIQSPLRVIPLTYDSKEFDLTTFENHQANIDIHYIIEGEEKIGITDLSKVTPNMEYNIENDYQQFDGKIDQTIILEKGDFLILFENETHVTAGIVNDVKTIKKLVFKVRV